mmetsp:Transcript_1635/g.2231  ORF Transcript_1635/g.2231 Transcript_1635/m.2231 type:complete len:219 (+) Transcript_1635:116-772(+)
MIRNLEINTSPCMLSAFESLKVLDLSYNAISPTNLEKLTLLPALENLDVTFNALESIPSSSVMSQFRRLSSLSLAHNRLREDIVLEYLSSCPALRIVNLQYNSLKRVPRCAVGEGCFPALNRLNIAHNNISTEAEILPAVLIDCLRDLVLYGNPICDKVKCNGDIRDNISNVEEQCIRRVRIAAAETREGLGSGYLKIITSNPRERPSEVTAMKRKSL